jgi:type IV pilus assembly protein PilM
MAILKNVGDFFGLDIGTTAIRVVQLTKVAPDSWVLDKYGYVPVDEKITVGSSADGTRKLGEAIMTAVGQSGIKTKNVAVGLPSSKTFTTIVELPTMPEQELRNTVKYQADQYIPMAIDDTKYDWALLGQSLHDPKQQEVIITSTSNAFAEERLELIENLGFNVVAEEPDPLADMRALLPAGVIDSKIIIDMGERSTDLVITYGESPRLVRNIPIGLRTLLRSIVQNLNVKDDQARQFILKFGLAQDRLEGQVYRAVESALDGFATELTKSIKFFQTRYPSAPISGTLLSGFAAAIPQLNDYITARTGITAVVASPWLKVRVAPADQQQLASVATEFSTVVGLAQRENKI